jgi:hypothetical protein
VLIVPIAGDTILTKDNEEYVVLSYTNIKEEPAVYVENYAEHGPDVVFFRDIAQIRGVRVEMAKNSKVFKALGAVKRKYHIPQPGDTMDVATTGLTGTLSKIVVVTELKLHNKNIGLHRGLVVCDEAACYTLDEIFNLSSEDRFKREAYLRYYNDYTPISS